jgi:hypothetical protein
MAPGKKRRHSKAPTELEPEEYVFHVREKAARKLRPIGSGQNTTNFDIEQNIRGIRAILAMNKEIWDRCKRSMLKAADNQFMTFRCYRFETVEASQNGGSTLQLTTTAQGVEKLFTSSLLFVLRAGLDIIPVQYMGDDTTAHDARFIDYELFFENSLILHDDVLEPFLAKLKTHLEEIQVCLGEIDGWLMVGHNALNFIETTFGEKLEIPDKPVATNCLCTGSHPDFHLCMRCHRQYPFRDRRRPQSHSVAPYQQHDLGRPCPGLVHVLKTAEVSGKFEATFTISDGSEQAKLQKFLDFISS